MKRLATIAFALVVGTSVVAEVDVPEGCTPIVSVMKTGCTATIIMQCENGFTEDTYTDGNRIDRHIFDANWDLQGYVSEANALSATLDAASGQGMTLEQLLKTGKANSTRTGTFKTRIVRGRKIGVESEYTLSDKTITISDIKFRKGIARRLFIVNPNNRGLDADWEIEIFVSEEKNLFIEGRSMQRMMGRLSSREHDPKAIIYPGQEGFGSEISPYECNEQ